MTHQISVPFLIAMTMVCIVAMVDGSLFAQEVKTSADPARVQIKSDRFGKTVRAADGQLLRGPSIGLFKYARQTRNSDYIYSDSYWKLLKANGFNALRLVFFDPWQRSHGAAGTKTVYPYADLNSPEDLAAMYKEFDHVVNKAAEHQMYVMVNYHDTGGYTDPVYDLVADNENGFARGNEIEYLSLFWKKVAARYAGRTHVFYELANEPVKWTAEEYTDRNLSDFKKVYDQIRSDAPQTHIVLLTFANHACFGGKVRMLDVARKMKALGVDFKNESVGYHPYNGYHPKANPSEDILRLKREFAIVNTEQNFPKGVVADSSDPDASGLDGSYLGVESNEKYEISWFHWQCDTPGAIRKNFMKVVIPDAIEKGYYWQLKGK